MHLSKRLRAELERRLELLEREQADDPAFQELPTSDLAGLVVIAAIAIVGVMFLQVA